MMSNRDDDGCSVRKVQHTIYFPLPPVVAGRRELMPSMLEGVWTEETWSIFINEAMRIDNVRKAQIKQSNCSGAGIGALIGSIAGVILRTKHQQQQAPEEQSHSRASLEEDGAFWIIIVCAFVGMVVGGTIGALGCCAEDPNTWKKRLQTLCDRTEKSTKGLLQLEIIDLAEKTTTRDDLNQHQKRKKLGSSRIDPSDKILYKVILTMNKSNGSCTHRVGRDRRREVTEDSSDGEKADSDAQSNGRDRQEEQNSDIERDKNADRAVVDVNVGSVATASQSPNSERACSSDHSAEVDDGDENETASPSNTDQQYDLEEGGYYGEDSVATIAA